MADTDTKLWRSLLPLMGVMAFVAVLAAFGATSTSSVLSNGCVILLVFLSSVAIGAVLGFLFGIPRVRKDQIPANKIGPTSVDSRRAYFANTTLEEMSDRLATIIIGVSLVQFDGIMSRLWHFGHTLPVIPNSPTLSAVIVVSMVIVGLLVGFSPGYLWSRNELPYILSKGEVVLDSLDSKQLPQGTTVKDASTKDIWKKLWNSDPNKDNFGSVSEGYGRRMRATWETPKPGHQLAVTIIVESTDPSKPLTGTVTFYLHPTFLRDEIEKEAENNRAKIKITVADAFTCGVVCDGGATRLELDLATAPGFPKEYIST